MPYNSGVAMSGWLEGTEIEKSHCADVILNFSCQEVAWLLTVYPGPCSMAGLEICLFLFNTNCPYSL
jgi:hypothetical protein